MMKLKYHLICWLICVQGLAIEGIGQTRVKPGFNVFSVEQDLEIGRQSAAEAERQLPLLRNGSVERYVTQIGQRLAAVAPGPKYPYQFKVVNVSDVNAFALPGGFMYINRGLIETTGSEGELAGVMAHEMAHVALRHGTNQASKAYLAEAGLGVLGGFLGQSTTGQIIGAIGGFGLNAAFLKFSRTAEEQADIVGAQMLAAAGYNPLDMASMFETLQQQAGGNPSKFEQFFSSHPAPGNRSKRIQDEARLLTSFRDRAPVGGFAQVRNELRRTPSAPSMQQLAQGRTPAERGEGSVGDIQIAQPSARVRTFQPRNGLFRIEYPDNWRPYESGEGMGVTLVPEGGAVQSSQGSHIMYGVIVNHYVPFEGSIGDDRGRRQLREATDDFTSQLMESNRHLRVRNTPRREEIAGDEALSVTLAGRSPVTGREERITLFTRELSDGHIIYCLLIAPGEDYQELTPAFQRMIASLRVNENAEHRAR